MWDLIEQENQKEKKSLNEKRKKYLRQQLLMFFSMLIVHTLLITGTDLNEIVYDFVYLNQDDTEQKQSSFNYYASQYSMLLLAVICVIFGYLIDLLSLRKFRIFILCWLSFCILSKLLDNHVIEVFFNKDFNFKSGIRISLSFDVFRMALNFIFQVALFNWFSRKMLLTVVAVFDMNLVVGLAFAYLLSFNRDTKKAQMITGIVASIIIILLLIPFYYIFAPDPIDKNILINEQATCYTMNMAIQSMSGKLES